MQHSRGRQRMPIHARMSRRHLLSVVALGLLVAGLLAPMLPAAAEPDPGVMFPLYARSFPVGANDQLEAMLSPVAGSPENADILEIGAGQASATLSVPTEVDLSQASVSSPFGTASIDATAHTVTWTGTGSRSTSPAFVVTGLRYTDSRVRVDDILGVMLLTEGGPTHLDVPLFVTLTEVSTGSTTPTQQILLGERVTLAPTDVVAATLGPTAMASWVGTYCCDGPAQMSTVNGPRFPSQPPGSPTQWFWLPEHQGYCCDFQSEGLNISITSTSDPRVSYSSDRNFYVRGDTLTNDFAARRVISIYNDLFGRDPDPGGLSAWSGALRGGQSPALVANAITNSTEYRSGLIRTAYTHYLHRTPSQAEVDGWLAAFAHGTTPQQLEMGFAASDEFHNASGSDAQWVADLYTSVLGRAASPSEINAWVTVLQHGTSRNAITMGFELSVEHLTTLLNTSYQSLLGRDLDPTGRNGWIAALNGTARYEQVIAGIIASSEYQEMAR